MLKRTRHEHLLLAALATSTVAVGGSAAIRRPATIQQAMDTLIDPAADVLWQAVSTVEQHDGTIRRVPRTAVQWGRLRRHAIDLIGGAERIATRLPVGGEGQRLADANTPGTRTARQIRIDIDRDPARFGTAAARLRAAGIEALAAIDAGDDRRLLIAGEKIDAACEACHHAYWYPRTPPLRLPDRASFGRTAMIP